MSDRWLFALATTAGAGLLLAWAVTAVRAVDPVVHDRYALEVRRLSALDSRIDQLLLEVDAGLLRHYDSLVETGADLHRLAVGIQALPAYVAPAAGADLAAALVAFREALAGKEELIEQFKSDAAILRNSLRFVPLAARAASDRATDPARAAQVQGLLRDLLAFHAHPDTGLSRGLQAGIAELRAGGTDGSSDLGIFLAHAQVVADLKPSTADLLRRLASQPTAARAEAVALAYDRAYRGAVAAAAIGRLLRYGLGATALALAAAGMVVRLRRSASALRVERANAERLLRNQLAGVQVRQRYTLDRRLGEGGMGVVWAATHNVTHQRVALKFLKGTLSARSDVRRRLLREARAAGLLHHPNVVQIHDILTLEDGSPVLVIDLLEGHTLGEALAERGRLPLGEVAAILLQVGSALLTAHRAGVVHRDLKPHNIFLLGATNDGAAVKVLDFGVAKLVADAVASMPGDAITRTGDVLGTPAYMSPEQAFGEPDLDYRTDLWAFGIVLFECLAGRRPFAGDNPGQFLKCILTEEPPAIESFLPEVPADVAELVNGLLCKDRDRRLSDLARALEVLGRHAGPTTAAVPTDRQERLRARRGLLGTLLARIRPAPRG